MRRLAVDIDLLTEALESHDFDSAWVLDLDTGDVIPVFDPAVTGDSETSDEVERNPNRYLPIEPITSHESFGIMERFAAELAPGEAQSSLLEALQRRHPFREFKASLAEFPDLRERWFQYHDLRLKAIAEEWLEANSVKASPPSRQKRT